MTRNEKGRSPKAGSGRKIPTSRQQQILDAYFEGPNAAAVARALRVSERNVRRIVQQFDDLLVERRQQRFEERLQRIDARHARTQVWADSTLGEALDRLDELAASKNEGVALRATRMKLDIALLAPPTASIPQTSEADRLAELENDPGQGGESAWAHRPRLHDRHRGREHRGCRFARGRSWFTRAWSQAPGSLRRSAAPVDQARDRTGSGRTRARYLGCYDR
jgi:hypothetical protein